MVLGVAVRRQLLSGLGICRPLHAGALDLSHLSLLSPVLRTGVDAQGGLSSHGQGKGAAGAAGAAAAAMY